ncbi:reverse transcriptase domain-containing protein [uncultured Sphingomonas sp.]|uniref:reverse transcriptase domain-containing protein n=1 Tax=uncultured Sphingomonas sp. TaxID=158754 RepID=UPI0025CF39DB|nr:reverse transcriptase domain-containing protein [uncultured Sphingomonas sp.]
MQTAIRREIKSLCNRLFAKAIAAEKTACEHRERFEKRTGVAAVLSIKPSNPYPDRHFDPKYCKRNANLLSKVIWHKFQSQQYKPRPAVHFQIDKPGGGKRDIMAFSIPDSALANVLMRRIRERNLKRFSPHSFAYHPDKNIFDAVLDLRGYIVSTDKIYSVQVDFTNYFESIPSALLRNLMDDRDLLIMTDAEKAAVREFMFHQHAQRKDYALGRFGRRRRGTPQGSSISLLLANLANHNLDVRLEKMPGKFVRFADDVTAVCGSYESAVAIEGCFQAHCRDTGILINVKKSPGIAILAEKNAEIRTTSSIDYLGYRFTPKGLTLSDATIARIKRRISRLMNIYLVHYIKTVSFNPHRVDKIAGYDWDLLGLITEIRNYLYGGLSEAELVAMMRDGKKLKKMRGLMSFYALLDDDTPLVSLDGWLVNTMKRVTRKRDKILQSKYGVMGLTPSERDLIMGTWIDPANWRGEKKADFKIPSFRRGWRAARKYYFTYGLKDIVPPKYGYQYSNT